MGVGKILKYTEGCLNLYISLSSFVPPWGVTVIFKTSAHISSNF